MQIDEKLAEEAKRLYSFSDYKKDSETENYNNYVCRFNNIKELLAKTTIANIDKFLFDNEKITLSDFI